MKPKRRYPFTLTNRQIAWELATAVLQAPAAPGMARRTILTDPATDAVLDTLGRLGYAFCDAADVDAIKDQP